MDSIVQAYQQLPKELLPPLGGLAAAILGSLAAFTGVIISNRAAERRQRVELQAAEQRARVEREESLKRSLYLETLDSIGAVMGRLPELWNVNKELGKWADGMTFSQSPTYRTYLVASPRTVAALMAVNEAIGTAGLDVMPILIRHGAIVAIEKQFQTALEALNDEDRRLDQEASGSDTAPDRRSAIEQRRAEIKQLSAATLGRLTRASESNLTLGLDILKLGAKVRTGIARLIATLIVEIRAELHLQDGSELVNLVADAERRSIAKLDEAISKMQALIPSLTRSSPADPSNGDGSPH